jgi:hypothetical protein
MLYREIVAVSFDIYTKHIQTLRATTVELLSVEPGSSFYNCRV